MYIRNPRNQENQETLQYSMEGPQKMQAFQQRN